MAFSGVGFFSLAPGTQIRTTWSFPGGNGDRGAQYFSAHPLTPSAEIISFDQAKFLGSDGRFRYRFTARNAGGFPVNFNVQGGGFS